MNLIRVIEEFRKSDTSLQKEYLLNIKTKDILKILNDLKLNEDDCPHEIYDSYELTKNQIRKLKPFIYENIEVDTQQYYYQLSCYEGNANIFDNKEYKKTVYIGEYSKESMLLKQGYDLNILPVDIKLLLPDLQIEKDDQEVENGYILTLEQIGKLKPFLKRHVELKENMNKYIYYIHNWMRPNT